MTTISAFTLSDNAIQQQSFAALFEYHLFHTLGLTKSDIKAQYIYQALAYTLRDKLIENWNETRNQRAQTHRHAYYLSMEYLIGRSLTNAITSLQAYPQVKQVLETIGVSVDVLAEFENDAALGNGGLGRLAACFIDSCASMNLPVTGYGIRYEYGMFTQKLENGYQVEEPDHWLRSPHVWEIRRPSHTKRVKFGGHTEIHHHANGHIKVTWHSTHDVNALAYDIPIPGFQNKVVNTLRLWKSEAPENLQLDKFNEGNYADAVADKIEAEKISMVLYPNDSTENGKLLRLCQQYFLASASLQDVVHQWVEKNGFDFSEFHHYHCFQLNDTHPACAVAELMRLLVDEYNVSWDEAWKITTHCMAYTNHTLLPEALEKWSVKLFRKLLPRLLEIIFEINARFLAQVAKQYPGDLQKLRDMSIIDEGHDKQIRMAHLAIVGSYSVNGVAALHTQLLCDDLFKPFSQMTPEKFNNKTNGVTFRRWLINANPKLAALISAYIGHDWVLDNTQIHQLSQFRHDPVLQESWHAIKQENKQALADLVAKECNVTLNVNSIFDVQVKRIHEYKRQLLNVLHVIHLYRQIKLGNHVVPRSVIIAGKAAPGYKQAKLIIKLINNVARLINNDSDCHGKLNLVFLPNYRVTSMEVICPGTDLSEQISTAGYEASGTGNMKFMLNGALTIGTLDGANVEMLDAVGEEYFFRFGYDVEQIKALQGNYHPKDIIHADENLHAVMKMLADNYFSQFEAGIFDPIITSIYSENDPWKVAADFSDFVAKQEHSANQYLDRKWWLSASIENTAKSGFFSSDRTIAEYNRDIWKLR